MNKICTDLSQSKKLLELGFDVNTADMVWIEDYLGYDSDGKRKHGKYRLYGDMLIPAYGQDSVPAWSLNPLLNIIKNRKDCNKVELLSNYSSKWALTTTYYDSIWKEKEIIAEDPIDAAFEMVVWLKENVK